MDTLLRDLRFAVRFLLRNWRSSSIAILCLATGIAMTTTTFGSVNPWVFRPLPWPEPDRLVDVSSVRAELPDALIGASGPDFRDWVRESRELSELAAFARTNFNISADDEPQRIMGARVSSSVFSLFRENPILGRNFTAEEDVEGRGDVVILSHELWRQRFDSDQGVLGEQI